MTHFSSVQSEAIGTHGVFYLQNHPCDGYSVARKMRGYDRTQASYLYLAAKVRPDGSREVFVSGLDIISDRVESVTLRNNSIKWLGHHQKGYHE